MYVAVANFYGGIGAGSQSSWRKSTDLPKSKRQIFLNQVYICRNQTPNFIGNRYIGSDCIGRCKYNLPYNHGHAGCSCNINIVDTYSTEMEYNLISIFYKDLPHTNYIKCMIQSQKNTVFI